VGDQRRDRESTHGQVGLPDRTDTGTTNAAQGSVSSTPAVDGRFLYFNDMSGFLTKLDRFTGKPVWRKNYVNDLSVPGLSSRAPATRRMSKATC